MRTNCNSKEPNDSVRIAARVRGSTMFEHVGETQHARPVLPAAPDVWL